MGDQRSIACYDIVGLHEYSSMTTGAFRLVDMVPREKNKCVGFSLLKAFLIEYSVRTPIDPDHRNGATAHSLIPTQPKESKQINPGLRARLPHRKYRIIDSNNTSPTRCTLYL